MTKVFRTQPKNKLPIGLFLIGLMVICGFNSLLGQAQTGKPSSYMEEAKRKAAEKYLGSRPTLNRREGLRVAILPIKTTTGMPMWWDGGFDPGRAITDMIVTGLSKSKRFTVFDRNNLNMLMMEQKLGDSGLVTAETAAEIGRLAGVQYLLCGTLVEFTKTSSGGGGMSIPTPFGGFGGGGSRTKVRTAVEVQLLDVNTGLVAAAISGKDETSVGGSNFSLSVRGYSAGGGHEEFVSSGLGKSMNKVALNIVDQLEKTEIKVVETFKPLEGYVMGVEGDQVFINIGSNEGVVKGMNFSISRTKEMVDPVSGTKKVVQMPLADVKIISVQDEVSVGTVPGAASMGIQAKDYAKRK